MHDTIKDEMLNIFKTYVPRVVILEDPADGVVLNGTLDSHAAKVIDVAKNYVWTVPYTSGPNRVVSIVNAPNDQPLVFVIPVNKAPNKMGMMTAGTVVYGLIDLTGVPSYAGGYGAYVVRSLVVKI